MNFESTEKRMTDSIKRLEWLVTHEAPQDFIECEKSIIISLQKLENNNKEWTDSIACTGGCGKLHNSVKNEEYILTVWCCKDCNEERYQKIRAKLGLDKERRKK